MPQNLTLRGVRIDHVSEDERTTRLARESGNLARKRNTSEMQESLPHFFLLPHSSSAASSSSCPGIPLLTTPTLAEPMFVFSRQSIILKRVCGKLYRGSGRATRPAVEGVANEEQSLATLGRAIGGAVFCDIGREGEGLGGRRRPRPGESINYAISDPGDVSKLAILKASDKLVNLSMWSPSQEATRRGQPR